MRLLALLASLLGIAWAGPSAQVAYEVRPAASPLTLDGAIDDWEGVPAIELVPGSVQDSEGRFGEGDLALRVRFLWDEDHLYAALDWEDDVVDVKEVRRRDAVYVMADGTRRDRMYFYDNVKLAIRRTDYNYILWLSPKADGNGPYSWQRLLDGSRGRETAAAAPLVAAREHDGRVTVELRFVWKELRLKGKKNETVPMSVIVADSDAPQQLLDLRARSPKWLAWQGQLRLVE